MRKNIFSNTHTRWKKDEINKDIPDTCNWINITHWFPWTFLVLMVQKKKVHDAFTDVKCVMLREAVSLSPVSGKWKPSFRSAMLAMCMNGVLLFLLLVSTCTPYLWTSVRIKKNVFVYTYKYEWSFLIRNSTLARHLFSSLPSWTPCTPYHHLPLSEIWTSLLLFERVFCLRTLASCSSYLNFIESSSVDGL